MFDQTQMKQMIQAADQAWYACPHQTCLIHRTSNTRTKEMFYAFDRMFDGLQILSNKTKHDQTRSNSTKQGVQTVKCLVTKQCLMVFGRQTFIVCPGPYTLNYAIKRANAFKTMSNWLVLLSRWARNRLSESAWTQIVSEPVRHTVEI